jgi:hypothetical protein
VILESFLFNFFIPVHPDFSHGLFYASRKFFSNIFLIHAEKHGLEAEYLSALREKFEMTKLGQDTTAIDEMIKKLESLIEAKTAAAAAAAAERALVKVQADRELKGTDIWI